MNAYRAMTPLRSTLWLFLISPAPCGFRPVLSSGGHSHSQALPPIALQGRRSEELPWRLRPSSRYFPWESTASSQSLSGSAPARLPSSQPQPLARRCICVVLSSFPFRSITSCYRVYQTQHRAVFGFQDTRRCPDWRTPHLLESNDPAPVLGSGRQWDQEPSSNPLRCARYLPVAVSFPGPRTG